MISVEQGKLLRFSIDKGDMALYTALYGPAGTKLLEHVSQDFEIVELSFAADTPGTYRIELQSREQAETQRQYDLRVEPLTAVTQRDRKDSEARQALADAELLRAEWTEASLRRAIEHYDQAALALISVDDFSNASRSALKAGNVYFGLSDFPQALKEYQKAATLAEKISDRVAQASALSQLGLVYSYMGNNDLAEENLSKALGLFKSGEVNATPIARNAHGRALNNLAEVTYSKGNLTKALIQFERARDFLKGDRKGEANTHLFAGYIAGTIGLVDKAMSELSQALDLYRTVNNKTGEGLALTTLGLVPSQKGDQHGAIKLRRTALEIFSAIGDRHSKAIALNGLGQAYEKLHAYPIALDNYKNSQRLFQSIGAEDLATVTMVKVARMYRLTRQPERALEELQNCVRLSHAAGKARTEVMALNEMARAYEDLKRNEQTSQQLRNVLQFYESSGDRRGQAVALNTYGEFLLRNGQKEQALNTFRRALELSEALGDPGVVISTLYNLARAHRDLGAHEVALSFIQRSLKNIEELRNNVGSPELRASYLSGVLEHHKLCIDILMQLDRLQPGKGFDVAALLINETGRARSLLDLLSESPADLRRGATAKLLNRERELRGYLRLLAKYKMELSAEKRDAIEIEEVAQQMAQLKSEYQEIQAQLREQQPPLLSLERFVPASLEQIQNELRNTDTLLLQYSLGEERSYLWAITGNSSHSYELPSAKKIQEAATEFYKLLIARQGAEDGSGYRAKVETADKLIAEKGKNLSELLLGPVADQLRNRKLLLVTEGALQLIPFEALPLPGAHVAPENLLMQTSEVDRSPSISTLIAIRSALNRPVVPQKVVAVIADPVFSRNDDRVQSESLSPAVASAASEKASSEPTLNGVQRNGAPIRLAHASEEADAILAAAPRGTTMVAKGFDASCETVMSPGVGQYQIVHFATHGFLDSEHPDLSGIVLAMVDRNGAEKNGLMPLNDIYNLDLSAELTVLSACQTALGKDIKGEGLVGLTHSFISAGSKSVVASLWKVDDRATAALMADFYDALLQKGMTTGEALRWAKLKMMQDQRWSAPYYWAGFVLQGEYTNRIAVERNSWLVPGALLLFVVLISSGVIVFQIKRFSRKAAKAQRKPLETR